MKYKHFKEISEGIGKYNQEISSRNDYYSHSTPGLTNQEKDSLLVKTWAKEDFEEIKNNFAIPSCEEEYPSFDVVTRVLPYNNLSEKYILFNSDRIKMGCELEYYFGNSFEDLEFMGLTTVLEFPYNNERFNRKLLSQENGPLTELEDISNKFEGVYSLSPKIKGKVWTKEVTKGMEYPFFDGYPTVNEPSYHVNLRFFEAGKDTSRFSDFLFYVNEKVKSLDQKLKSK